MFSQGQLFAGCFVAFVIAMIFPDRTSKNSQKNFTKVQDITGFLLLLGFYLLKCFKR
jgi:hypothetical protein